MNLDNNQVVCGCFQVTVGNIKGAIENGAKTFSEVQEVTSAGKGCKKCVDSVKQLVDSMIKEI